MFFISCVYFFFNKCTTDRLYFLFITKNFICSPYVATRESCYMYTGYRDSSTSFGKFKKCVYFYDDELKTLKTGKIVKWCVVGTKTF